MEKKLSRRDFLKIAGATGAAAFLPSGERLTPEKKFFHNDSIGIEMSQFLDGIIDLKYYNQESGEWTLYNNIVPEVQVNGVLNNAEMFGLDTQISLISDTEDGQIVEIQYGKSMGETKVGNHRWTGNGARFSVYAHIPTASQHITFSLEEEAGSAQIEKASLTNFFGAAEKVRYLSAAEGIEDVMSKKYGDINDGVHEFGQFEDFALPITAGGDALVTFGADDSNLIQYQKIPHAGSLNGRCEARETPWTEEQSVPGHVYNPGRRWFEMVQIMQQYSPEATWTFGYEFKNDFAWSQATTSPSLQIQLGQPVLSRP